MGLIDFQHASIRQKVSSLFVVLLSFLLGVIVFSVFKLNQLNQDMREVAYLDIPLSKLVTQLEFIELEQHLQLEEYQLQQQQHQTLKPHQQLVFQKRKLKSLQDHAVSLLEENLQQGRVVLNVVAHQQVLHQLVNYRQLSDAFEQHLSQIYEQSVADASLLAQTEALATELELEQKNLLQRISQMTSNDANFTEQQEQDFLLINIILGVCALVIGLMLTLYITQIILRRVNRIQSKIKRFGSSLSVDDNRTVAASLQANRDELAELEHDVGVLMRQLSREIASREEVEQKLLQLATRDKLTGVYNRHKWDEQINHSLSLAERGYPFGLILLDIDFFKKVNDQYGHSAGDKILKLVTNVLQHDTRDIDTVFRLGGEEFAIICPMQDLSSTLIIAEKIRVAIAQTHAPQLPAVTVSAGVASYRQNDSAATILKRADQALYQAKGQGRNQVVSEAELS
ncbi:GGDEF domain-containing protein [Shewanella sp. C32]|uniref:diguanylate cyclase n=1 Tax=Shewanella electrica TaxID=515560 RepID=A0ABT2FJH6_9GAMM|nr:GGDEF domain-containing protein [Shewanella electrica]MCH1924243.1 GGDEF domain-containing protein [Shewanella electrica]MCS4556146.1 GGDEF domain-containing protein [Shewanella electrica]